MKISKYEQFNESSWNDITNFFKRIGSDRPRTEYVKDLKEYDLSLHPSSDQQSMSVKHKGRIVAEISADTTLRKNFPVWNLWVYFYESEIPKRKNYKTPSPFKNQEEQPYGRAIDKFASETDNALKVFLDFWKNNTKSGRQKNPRYKVKTKTEYVKDLKEYGLSLHPSNDQQSMSVKHKGRIVAEISVNDTLRKNFPVWDLWVYFYESETPKTKNYKTPKPFEGQKEQPYGRASDKFPSETDNALKVFLDFWKNNTKSGRQKNPRYKVKF